MVGTTNSDSLRGVVDVCRQHLAAFLFVASMIPLAAAVVVWGWNEAVVAAVSVANVVSYGTALKSVITGALLSVIFIVTRAVLRHPTNKRKNRLLE